MLIVGSDDGVYRVTGLEESDSASSTKVLDAGRVMRLERFDGIDGVFAATKTGLYRSVDGKRWTNLGVPRETVYAVGSNPSEGCLYAGTRPAHVYRTDSIDGEPVGEADPTAVEWNELDGFQELPSRGEWRLPRHDDLAQVRDLRRDPAASDRLVAGVEVGGVHVTDDGGATWVERSDGVHDDVHELHVVGPETYVAATGAGLYRTDDAGRTWARLDESVRQSYFRRAFSIDGVVYASAALSNSSTWNDEDAAPVLVASHTGDALDRVDLPRADETITGMTATSDGDLVVATHRGSLFVRSGDDWDQVGRFPVPGRLTGRYTPITVLDD